MALHDYVELASTAVFLASTALNIFFIYIVHAKTKQDLGMYKYVMIWFAIGNIAYSLAEFISKPTIHIYMNSYMTISRSFMRRYKEWGFVSLYVFISMYGANTAILALHFICRYIIICKHNWMFLIEKTRYIIMWVTIVFFWGFTYGFIAYYCFAPTEEFFNYARASVRERFNEKIEDMPFFAVFIYEVIAGKLMVHWKCCVGLAIIITMMLTTLTIMISTGFIMVTTLKKVTMSEKTKMLQTQLLRALLFQATVPFLLSYLPRFLMFAFVIKGYPSHKIYTFVPVMITSYTCLDPLAVMYFIHDYREAVHTLFHCDDHALTKNLWVASYSRLSYRQQSSV